MGLFDFMKKKGTQPISRPQEATPMEGAAVKQNLDLAKSYNTDPMHKYSDALTKIAFNSYLERNSTMGLYCLLFGRGNYKVEAFPGAGHNDSVVFQSITNYAIMHPEVNVEYAMNEAMNLAARTFCKAERFILIINYVDLYLDGKKKQSVPFTLDLPQILTTLKERIANYDKLRDDKRFMELFEKSKAYLLNEHSLEI